jgi:Glycosyl transferase family 2
MPWGRLLEALPAIAGWVLLLVWAGMLFPLWPIVQSWWLRRLASALPSLETWPLISIVVPARDEGVMIEAALRSLLALDYPHLEVIAVDDRSTDETGVAMDRLAARDARLRVIHIAELPAGWLGKNHALQQGARAATGDLLLFTDGDVLFAPETLRLAATWVERQKVDHLCLNPQMIPGGYWESALINAFGMLFFINAQPWFIGTSVRWAYCGIGAFNLVRRRVYEAIGGHEPIRFDCLDDVNLGALIKRSGYKQHLLLADDLVRVRWQTSFWGVIRGLEKNSFAALHYSLAKVVGVTLLLALVCFAPYVMPLAWPDARAIPCLLTLVLVHATYTRLAMRMFAGRFSLCPAFPVAILFFIFVIWRSAIITLRQGGIRWRDTFYPLAELRARQYRP